jgi:hypothetical protein
LFGIPLKKRAHSAWIEPQVFADLDVWQTIRSSRLLGTGKRLVAANVTTRNQQVGRELFRLNEHEGGASYSVFRTEGGQRNAIDFTIGGNAVHVNHYGGQTDFDAEPVVDEFAQLKCKVGDSLLTPEIS